MLRNQKWRILWKLWWSEASDGIQWCDSMDQSCDHNVFWTLDIDIELTSLIYVNLKQQNGEDYETTVE